MQRPAQVTATPALPPAFAHLRLPGNSPQPVQGPVSAAEQRAFGSWLRTQQARQPDAIRVPSNVPAYRSPLPRERYDRTMRLWEESRRYDNSKRWFFRHYASRPVRPVIVYRNYVCPAPVYQYWPFGSSSYYYWGYTDSIYDPYRSSSVVVVYAPPETRYNVIERTKVVYTSTDAPEQRRSVSEDQDVAGVRYPGIEEDISDAERVAKDIETAWERGNLSRLAGHVDPEMPVRIYDSGEYLEYLKDREFLLRMRDLMDDNGTRAFLTQRIVPVRPGEVMIYARHDLETPTKRAETLYERYTIERLGKRWLISAYESSPSRLLE
ncbi:MAG: hypothetical protein IT209_07295 [Armatimonadetes bacterium]|nr:hypothetical protein [Armatimonadota bacterium]